jgi:hypothetical protein
VFPWVERDGPVPPDGGGIRVDQNQWPCPACGDERAFVQPPCADGHTDDGGECPEWACADCGTAVFVEVAPIVAAPLRRAA